MVISAIHCSVFSGTNKDRYKQVYENTELEFDDGITEDHWDEVAKAIKEINGDEEE